MTTDENDARPTFAPGFRFSVPDGWVILLGLVGLATPGKGHRADDEGRITAGWSTFFSTEVDQESQR